MVSERATRIGPAALEIGRKPELIAQRHARLDAPRLLGFDVAKVDRAHERATQLAMLCLLEPAVARRP
ncbi:MAG: hypothetical protein JO263_10365 [Candidatus Eremiobacteraeota bacterium]|nr:hypothetical protein [Candidatus Eremiobacteraeota bacterium]